MNTEEKFLEIYEKYKNLVLKVVFDYDQRLSSFTGYLPGNLYETVWGTRTIIIMDHG